VNREEKGCRLGIPAVVDWRRLLRQGVRRNLAGIGQVLFQQAGSHRAQVKPFPGSRSPNPAPEPPAPAC